MTLPTYYGPEMPAAPAPEHSRCKEREDISGERCWRSRGHTGFYTQCTTKWADGLWYCWRATSGSVYAPLPVVSGADVELLGQLGDPEM